MGSIADCFGTFMRSRLYGASGLEDAYPVMVVEWLSFLDFRKNDYNRVYCSVPKKTPEFPVLLRLFDCRRLCAFGSLHKIFVSKLERAYVWKV